MGIIVTPEFRTPAGRIRGSFVYMLLCCDDGPIYIKIGVSDSPAGRLAALGTATPVKPVRFAYVNVATRKAAFRLEQDLLDTLSRYRAHGEWLKVGLDEKDKFNHLWKQSFGRHASKNWPLRWEQIALKHVAEYARRKQSYFRRRAMRRGKAYRDAVQDMKARNPA